MTSEETAEVYKNLTEANDAPKSKDRWNAYLLLCCFTASMASFTFGYNIGATNLPTPLIKSFFTQRYYPAYSADSASYALNAASLATRREHLTSDATALSEWQTSKQSASASGNTTLVALFDAKLSEMNQQTLQKHNVSSLEAFVKEEGDALAKEEKALEAIKIQLDTAKPGVEQFNTLLWTFTTALFVVGGMIGAFASKAVAEKMGRKKGIIFHYVFVIAGAVIVFLAPYLSSPECVIVSRFLYGVQGGMACGLIPTYLTEISPAGLRGATGVIHQLFITIGILIAQTLGFRQLLGLASTWHLLLALPFVPGVVGALGLLLFFPETPRALLVNNRDEHAAREALSRLRNTKEVNAEMEQMVHESGDSKSDEHVSLKQLFTLKELRWPLLTGLALQLAQQLCGINAVFFYSESIFRRAAIQDEHIQYAVFATGLINVICTIVCVPLIDKLGRKPLLVYPMFVIIVDFLLLTAFLILQPNDKIYSYLSIVCIIIFIVCFAVGLGPIPFIYVAECFKQEARSAALAICMFTNWVANLVLTLTFPYMAEFLSNYVFLVFTVIVGITLAIIIKKVPETKNRSVEDIMAHFNGTKKSKYEEPTGKLLSDTKV